MHEHPDITSLIPPGTYLETVPHPSGAPSKTMELAVFKEHRFSFYFWNRWVQQMDNSDNPPALVTIDWHRDFAPPSASERAALDKLDLSNHEKVAKTTWAALDTHNDSHLLSAAYLNLIGDVFLLKNYGEEQHETFTDSGGRPHVVHEFRSYKNFQEALFDEKQKPVILDIDLDFFVKDKTAAHQLKNVDIYSRQEIAEIINRSSPLFEKLLGNLLGMTIATEPRYCGGIVKSNRILEAVLSRLFTEEMQWNHLISST